VWTAGLNSDGQLGNGTTTNRPSFASVAGVAGVDDISSGRQHAPALRGGTVYSWGNGGQGALGTASPPIS
jgi:alpha-tubulin suppressor-like RCC1 family protein